MVVVQRAPDREVCLIHWHCKLFVDLEASLNSSWCYGSMIFDYGGLMVNRFTISKAFVLQYVFFCLLGLCWRSVIIVAAHKSVMSAVGNKKKLMIAEGSIRSGFRAIWSQAQGSWVRLRMHYSVLATLGLFMDFSCKTWAIKYLCFCLELNKLLSEKKYYF